MRDQRLALTNMKKSRAKRYCHGRAIELCVDWAFRDADGCAVHLEGMLGDQRAGSRAPQRAAKAWHHLELALSVKAREGTGRGEVLGSSV